MNKVSILGRPNVGKSSIFNILVRKADAIVSEKENMTRDVKYGVVKNRQVEYQIADMGGLTDGKGDFLDLVNEKIASEIQASDLVLVIFDIRNIIEDDRRILDFARKNAKRFIIIANKSDGEQVEVNNLENIYRLGVDDFISVSCKNFRNLQDLRLRIINNLNSIDDSQNSTSLQHKKEVTVAILGRPNVGKSSLLNVFLKEERAIVSDISGTTRDSIDGVFIHDKKTFRIIDTAGIRKRNREKPEEEEKSLKRSIRSIQQADIVILMIDARDQVGTQDKKIAQTIKARFKPIIFVVNKWDLSPYPWSEYKKYLYSEFQVLKDWEVLAISCKKKKGIKQLKDLLLKSYRNYNRTFNKEQLKKSIQEALQRQPPQRVGGKRLQVFSFKQISRAPIIIEFIVNSTMLIKKNYIRYLLNMIKNDFNLKTTDVRITFKEK